jgi:chorismate dehydratase
MAVNPYRLVMTDDGTPSLWSEEFGQLMHTTDGALAEALWKHLVPCGVLDKAGSRSVLDIGFGLGYNVLATADEALRRGVSMTIVSLEYCNDAEAFVREIEYPAQFPQTGELIKRAYCDGRATQDDITVMVRFGDARKTIVAMAAEGLRFDAIYQDPFSPAKNPELWTLDYFSNLKSIMADDGMMTTYSAAVQVRRALVEAGFHIGELKSDQLPKKGTLASPSSFAGCFDEEYLAMLSSEIRATPYRDPEGIMTRGEILSDRIMRMADERLRRKDQTRSSSLSSSPSIEPFSSGL